ncbi:ATP-binding protein [Pseudomonas sp.]|uniref:hybrid sensor histidine kinase/response regulator n=1 Tax=Pseudomonas sp. TaxID=306 RepID=UPI0028AFFA30|nr:ATP-binding protein [Pseudomonas sp.]
MAERIRSFDWSRTDLGPIEQWSKSLSAAVQFLLASPVPLVMLWGRPGYMVYNDAYAVFAGGRHPFLLGSPVEIGWPEVAEFNRNVVDTCLAGGTLSYRNKELVLFRNGRPEDVSMDLYYSPVPEDDDVPAGVMAIVIETTQHVLSERRRQEAERSFRATNERLQLALNSGALLGLFVWDIKAQSLTGDERFARTFSYPVDEAAAGIPIQIASGFIHPDDLEKIRMHIRQTFDQGGAFNAECRIRRPNGLFRWVLASGLCEFDERGEPFRFPGVMIDMHERKMAEEALYQLTRNLEQRVAAEVQARSLAEEQLRQSQKLEAIGGLTGGVAHDFNNVLQVISSNLHLLARQEKDNPRVQSRVEAAINAVERGAKLSSQLLAFARRQALSPGVYNPAHIFEGLEELLQRALGETTEIDMHLPDDAWCIHVDRNQLENAILNLAINARDAMDGEGLISVHGDNVVLDEDYCAGKDISPGDYLCLSVADSGEGMKPEVLEHVFEPFFTNKAEGQGTGLGLSMVFGFVKQSGGHIDIQSAPGCSTTVRMYFARSQKQAEEDDQSKHDYTLEGRETILVVEDNEGVRLSVVELLQQAGYDVAQAPDADVAMQLLEAGAQVDLIFTDVVMPGRLKSTDLAAWAQVQQPAIPVLFTSGHTRDILSQSNTLAPNIHLLTKPYHPEDLSAMVRTALRG